MRNEHCRAWIMARKLQIMENEKHTDPLVMWRETVKNVKNEKYTLWDMDYGEKTKKKYWKMRHKHCDTCHMARNTEKSAK